MENPFSVSRWPAIVLAGFLVSGCASMDEDECRVADWRAIGYEDGVSGAPASHIGKRREACAEHGVRPDFAAYRQGREEGLREYCTPASGYRLGRKGRALSAICPAELQGDFRDAYKSGRKIYQAAAVVGATKSKLKRKRKELSDVRSSLTSKSAKLVAPSTDTERRIELLAEIHELASRKSTLENEIKKLSVNLDRYREKLAALEHSSVY
jgi:outer membrane murein-binding lipoprotein Lpp